MSADIDRYGVGFGAVDDPDSTYCRHAECVVLPTDPDPRYLTACERPAPARVPRPDTDAPVALCAWHLARFRDAYPRVWADLEADFHLNRFVPSDAVTSLDAAPDPFEQGGREWRLAAIDQQGHCHYVGGGGLERAVLEVDARFEQVDAATITEATQDDYFDGVARRVGWAAFADWVRTPESETGNSGRRST